MVALAKEIRDASNRGVELVLTEYELAFYDAVAENESARELMSKDTLRELSVALLDSVRQNSALDWTIRSEVKARMRVAVKRLLRKYGYPPDMELLAVDRVLEQAELLADLSEDVQ